MKALWVAVGLLLAQPAWASQECKPKTLSEYFQCQKLGEAKRVLSVFNTAGSASSYWPCLQDQMSKQTGDREQGIINSQLACERYFPAFEAALHKESDKAGYRWDIEDADHLRYYVFQIWAAN